MCFIMTPSVPLATPTLPARKEGSAMEIEVGVKRGSNHNQWFKYLIVQILLNISDQMRDLSEGQISYDLTFKWNLLNKQTSKWSITTDIEIENNLTATRREVGGDSGGKGRRVFRNNCKGHMDKTKVGWNREGGGDGWGGDARGKCRQLYLNNNKIIKKK